MPEHQHSWHWEEGSSGHAEPFCTGCGTPGEECEVCEQVHPLDEMFDHYLKAHNIDRGAI